MVDYRPLPDEHKRVFFEYTNYAFSPQKGPVEYDSEEHDTPRFNLGSSRGLYREGESDEDPLVVCRQYWLEANVRGERHSVAGLAGVASPPESRRKGLVRKLLECSLEEYRDRNRAVSVLWPFQYDFYRKYGWDTANDRMSYDCEPAALAFATAAVDDPDFVAVGSDSYGSLDDVYRRHSSEYALTLERDEAWWRHRILSNHGTDPFVYALERDGSISGYLVYTIDGEWESRTMAVQEMVFDDHDAFLSLLSFCHTHDSQVETVELPGPVDSKLLDLTPKPEAVDCTVETGPMVRIVDVESALSMVTYPVAESSGTTRRLTLSVSDPLVEWNDGCFELEVAKGEATCERTSGQADAELDIGALSQLLVGTRSARDLERVGRLRTASEAELERLEALFPETKVYLREHF
ncbi:GNAT family N-acetyltransferase [Halostagnicola bangensis]